MPSGKVRWFSADKGYGFLTSDDGDDVFVSATALPSGVTTLRKGVRVTFSLVEAKRGKQAFDVEVLASGMSLVELTRPEPDDMAAIVEDVIKLLDAAGNTLRRKRYPSAREGHKLAELLRRVADNFDVQE